MADTLQGTWVFNDRLFGGNLELLDIEFIFNFDSSSYHCTGLALSQSNRPDNEIAIMAYGDVGRVYFGDQFDEEDTTSDRWGHESFKTITITSKLSEVTDGDVLLTWLQANATKQADPEPAYPKINSFTYHGKQINNINGKHIRYVHDKRAGMDNTYEMVYVVQLATPQNVNAVGTTVSWMAVENATSYEIFVGGSSFGVVSTTSVDLSTLSGWASLTDGEYSVTIVAKADGYRDSEPSAAVSVTKSSVKFVQIFPTTTPDNYTLIENLNQSKIYSIQRDITQPEYITYLKYENGLWKLWTYEIVNGSLTDKIVDLSYLIYSQTANSVKFMAEYGSYFSNYTSGITIEGDIEATKADFAGFSPTTVYAYYVCFVEGTKITLSNGSTKLVQDIQYGDKVLCYDFYTGKQTTSYIDWMIPERVATKYWEIMLSDGTILNLVGSNGKSHRLYNITKQRFDYPQDFEADDLTLKEDGTTARVVSCKQIEKTVKFYNIASHEHINVYANGVLTSNRLNNRFKIVDNKFTDEKAMSDKEVADYIDYLSTIKAKQ